jgi:hypothetical protein
MMTAKHKIHRKFVAFLIELSISYRWFSKCRRPLTSVLLELLAVEW